MPDVPGRWASAGVAAAAPLSEALLPSLEPWVSRAISGFVFEKKPMWGGGFSSC